MSIGEVDNIFYIIKYNRDHLFFFQAEDGIRDHCVTGVQTCALPISWRPAADMGTARREIYTLSPGFSRASESSPDAAGTATLSKARAPLSGRTHSRAPCPSQRKENSPRGSRRLLRDRSRYRTGRLAAPISATPDSGI